MEHYLRELDMELVWGRVNPLNVTRVAQLINKTNQFNLTTRRYSEGEKSLGLFGLAGSAR